MSAMRLRWRGSTCFTTATAAGKSPGRPARRWLKAFRPPADAATATTSKLASCPEKWFDRCLRLMAFANRWRRETPGSAHARKESALATWRPGRRKAPGNAHRLNRMLGHLGAVRQGVRGRQDCAGPLVRHEGAY